MSLVASRHEHNFIELFGCNYFDFTMPSLESKIYTRLKEAISKDIFSWGNEMEWFEEIQAWSPKTKNAMEDILRRIIRPVLWEWALSEDVKRIDLTTRGKMKLFPENVKRIKLISSDKMEIAVVYENDEMEIRKLEDKNRKPLAFDEISFSLNGKKTVIRYKDGTTKVFIRYANGTTKTSNLEDIDLIFDSFVVSNDGKYISVNLRGTRDYIGYLYNKVKIRDTTEDYNRDIVFTELTSKQLLFIFLLEEDPSRLDRKSSELNRIAQSFSLTQQQELKKSYFPTKINKKSFFYNLFSGKYVNKKTVAGLAIRFGLTYWRKQAV